MPTLVLDPRWPDMIPASIACQIRGPVEYTVDVPAEARSYPHEPGAAWVLTMQDSPGAIRVPSLEDPIFEAQRVMREARRRGEWERAMTHESLIPYLLEESQEFAEAVGTQDMLKELADVFLQVLFHAEIAREQGAFSLDDVALSFTTKMQSRAPYLFDGSTGPVAKEEQDRLWEEGKRREAAESALLERPGEHL